MDKGKTICPTHFVTGHKKNLLQLFIDDESIHEI